MLILLNDPAGATGCARHPWRFDLTLQQNVELHLPAGGDAAVTLNGQQINPASDPAMGRLPTVADTLTVIRRPGTGLEWYWWVAIGAAAATVAAVALMPRMPDMGAAGKDSPNNRLTAQTNTARAYQAIPDVYGARRVWPDMIQPSTVEYIDHVKMVTEWLCISRGRGDISAVQYADTPIADIAGASWEAFTPSAGPDGYPESGSTTLEDVIETFESPEVNGQELGYPVAFATITPTGSFAAASGASSFTVTVPDGSALAQLKSLAPSGTAAVSFSYTPAAGGSAIFNATCTVLAAVVSGGNCVLTLSSGAWASAESGTGLAFSITPNGHSVVTIGPFTLSVDADRIRWNTVFLRGLKGSVQIRATWWQIGGAGAEIAGTRATRTDTYAADTFDARYWTTEQVLSARGRYRIQFERLTPQIGDQGADVAKLEEAYAVRHYASKVLPGVTVIRLTTRATEQATGYSERKFNLRWARHVRPLGTGALSHSRNFARAMAHIWTLAGGDIAELDTGALAAINAELGEDSPLLRFDMSLDDADMSLGERLQLVAGHARCRVWRDGTRWTVTRDQRQAYPVMQLDYRNLAAGGESAQSYSAHLPASYDGVEVEYVDEAEQSKKAYVRLNVSTGAVVAGTSSAPKKIQLPGCTTQTQAMNRAQLEARKLLYVRSSVQDTALGDAAQLGLGALVRWIDPSDFDGGDDGVQAGEVLAAAGDVIQTSEPLEWGGAAVGRMLFTGADGRYLGAPALCYPAPGGARLASVPAGLFVADGIAAQLGSRYTFAVGLTAGELEAAGLYTIEKAEPAGDGTLSVSLSQYDSRIYEAD
jgi:hypothetical protein